MSFFAKPGPAICLLPLSRGRVVQIAKAPVSRRRTGERWLALPIHSILAVSFPEPPQKSRCALSASPAVGSAEATGSVIGQIKCRVLFHGDSFTGPCTRSSPGQRRRSRRKCAGTGSQSVIDPSSSRPVVRVRPHPGNPVPLRSPFPRPPGSRSAR